MLITTNDGKLKEFNSAIADTGVILKRMNMTYPEIQANTLEEVVSFGMQWLDKKIHEPYVIDDSGLFISVLNGFPGVYSAYAYRTLGNAGMLKLMESASDRSAIFKTVIGLSMSKHHFVLVGECSGSITHSVKGTKGFGFDPIFVPSNSFKTFSEMDIGEKNATSHRGAALEKLKKVLASSTSF
ncbi:MAG: XTP/dITP diphosphatase [Thermoplasmata archaeon]|nr:XTP/dITP diphosphatase [Candidatus Sysuiplasma acidicola]MBX8637877.1 XTP/dITP diphosphatase [Candidatus Sysuiplasma acidicola]MBX8646982.1 XTP/dITP diphosphatase [Candidatus Sysuiplasma acidicola]